MRDLRYMGRTEQSKYIDAFAEDILELLALSGGEAEMEWVLRQVCRKHHVMYSSAKLGLVHLKHQVEIEHRSPILRLTSKENKP